LGQNRNAAGVVGEHRANTCQQRDNGNIEAQPQGRFLCRSWSLAPNHDAFGSGFSVYPTSGLAPVVSAGRLHVKQSAQLFLLSVDRRACISPGGRIVRVDFSLDTLAAEQRSEGFSNASGIDGRNNDLLAFHGRSLDLPISTPIPLEVTGEH
jgi:hypothetical protein